jgi:hypothetical protein
MKNSSLALFATACGFLLGSRRIRRRSRLPKEFASSTARLNTTAQHSDKGIRNYTIKFVLPAWLMSGLLDYFWHRKSRIETTSGPAESAMHSLMMAEGAAPVLGGLFLDVNAGLLAMMMAVFVAHQATAMWDVAYAVKRRLISPGEQHIHSALEMVPFCALSLMIALHYDQFLSLFGMGDEAADFEVRWKRDRLNPSHLVAILAATGVLQCLYTEEFWRCLRAHRRGLTGKDSPEAARRLYGSGESPESTRSNHDPGPVDADSRPA